MKSLIELMFCLISLFLATVTSAQFIFQDQPPCTRPSRCVLFSSCQDKNVYRNKICEFRAGLPMVCCLYVKNRPSTRQPPSTPRINVTTSNRTEGSSRPLTDLLPKDCGKPSSLFFNRIVGGEPVAAEVWPWLVLLYLDGNAECGGSFVAERWVLTAAHCVYTDSAAKMVFRPESIKIRKGASNLTSPATFYSVSQVVPHPGFRGTYTYANDVALLKLTRKVEFGETVRPICLPGSTSDHGDPTRQDISNRMAFLAGWGKTNQDERRASEVLMHTQVPIWRDKDCVDVYKKFFPITNTSFCAGKTEGGKDACQGDSGGPLMLPGLHTSQDRFYAVGIVSFGQGCAQPGFPGGYAKTRLYQSWIEHEIRSRS